MNAGAELFWWILLVAASLAYSAVGLFTLLAIERAFYDSEPPPFYRGRVAAVLQAAWPVTLMIVAIAGIILRIRARRRTREPTPSSAFHTDQH
ncbi:MAG TPA: hypothetical protein VN397_01910 [Candidatus Methylomirabilis sp.]|nr:hypothetical protein [Candidatus Methylomirabilis sp.]